MCVLERNCDTFKCFMKAVLCTVKYYEEKDTILALCAKTICYLV